MSIKLQKAMQTLNITTIWIVWGCRLVDVLLVLQESVWGCRLVDVSLVLQESVWGCRLVDVSLVLQESVWGCRLVGVSLVLQESVAQLVMRTQKLPLIGRL